MPGYEDQQKLKLVLGWLFKKMNNIKVIQR